MKKIGEHFAQEVEAAGLAGLPFAWGDDGEIEFGKSLTQAQIDSIVAVYDAHDPSAQAPG
ncbi:conserved hypothetical protein [Cupriavidus necator]|uniref:Uncharacterized protein n=1 Tax=Cupriavidus necator TaxID=106590 RepID=A0A1K0IRI2_CUPNE|nr:conserved hypothetical protein [Cupriavidus necator]